jgi:hypothetical protein
MGFLIQPDSRPNLKIFETVESFSDKASSIAEVGQKGIVDAF